MTTATDTHETTQQSAITVHVPRNLIGDLYDGHRAGKHMRPVYIDTADLQPLADGMPIEICPDCVKAYNAAARAECERQAQEAARRAAEEAEREARDAEEHAIIQRTTGFSDISRHALQNSLITAYRAGKDTGIWLDAMEALEEADMARAGVTSWDERDEKE